MQLTAFRIFKYRNIEDSGLVKLADRLTCIVGKNQSGKTNLLRTAATISESRLLVILRPCDSVEGDSSALRGAVPASA